MSVFNPETKVWQGPKVPWPLPLDKYINELVFDGLRKTPKRVVQIMYDDNSVMTCEELRSKVISCAINLRKLGVQSEDVVGVVCANSMDLMAYVNGIVQLGAIVNPMSVDHSPADLMNMFKQTQPKFIICDAVAYEKVRDVLQALGNNSLIYTTIKKIDGVPFAEDLFKETEEEENYQPASFKDPNSKIMAILTSSGSTGPAKGVCMSQTFFLKLFTGTYQVDQEVRSISFSPIIWGSAFGSLLLAAVSGETRIVTKQPFTPERFVDIVAKHKADMWLFNPPTLTLLLQSPLVESIDKSIPKMVLSLGGIVSVELRKRFKEVFPKTFLMIFYGLTEVSCAATVPGQSIDGLTVGYVLPNHEIKIADDDGKALGVGETGEICTRFSIVPFLGYCNNPEATKAALDEDGFIKTGDIGYVDEKGFVYVVDRKKDIFKYRGHHINPSEIENVIQALKAVEFVSVVGIPNDKTYNLTAAVIQKKKGFGELTVQEVVDYVAQNLPDYKQLHGGAYFVDRLPTTATDKILKIETRKIAVKMFNERQI